MNHPPKRSYPLDLETLLKSNPDVERIIAHTLWNIGDIRYKLKPCQEQMYEAIFSKPHFKYVIKCARRLGKSFFLCSVSIMLCLRKNYCQVRYAAPTNKALKKIVIPIMRRILEDCPENLKPQFLTSEAIYRFPNGSEIHLAGVNNDHAENLRGTACDLFVIDEAGFIDDLKYLIDDVAMPQFLDPDGQIVKDRRLIISSSPARTPAHEFTDVARQAEFDGAYSHYDIYSGGYPKETIDLFKKEAGGEESTTWKREYLALDVVDANYALVPEWKASYVEEPAVNEYFPLYLKYVSLDIGVRDLTVALFAHYDFLKATLYIHDEIVLSGPEMTTERLAGLIRSKESEIFPDMKVHKRVSDVDLLLLNDLRALHNLYFAPTDKGKLEEMVNEVRIWVNAGRIKVSTKCKQLIGCLSYGVWNENRTDFERVLNYGHFDALASLMYLVRNIDVNINPIPPNYGKSKDDHWIIDDKHPKNNAEKFKKVFNVR